MRVRHSMSHPSATFQATHESVPKVDQSSSNRRDWLALTVQLADTIAAMEPNEYLIICRKAVNHFVQFASEADGILTEAVSNNFIEPHAALSVEAYQYMTELGWKRANAEPPVGKPGCSGTGRSPNFFIYCHRPVDYIDLAILTGHTLNVVYGVPHPSELQYKAFTEDGVQLRFDQLQLKRVDPGGL